MVIKQKHSRNTPTLLGLILSFGLLYSCGKHDGIDVNIPEPMNDDAGKKYFESANDLNQWNETSAEVVKQKNIGDFEYTVKELSPDVMALQELKGVTNNASAYEEAKSHYTELLYFKLNVQNPKATGELLKYNLESSGQYTERIKYCSFEINRDIYITNGKDTVPCALHEFERTFNIQSGLNFMLGFPKISSAKGLTLVYHDQLFKQGLIKFSYANDSEKLPYLKIK